MGRFIPVFVVCIIVVIVAALSWPRFFLQPRPEPLSRLNTMLRQTEFGQSTAQVLGVSNEQQVVRLSLQQVGESVMKQVATKTTDLFITHLSRLIIERFGELPQNQQQKILESLSTALSQSEQLPEASQSSTQGDNNTRNNE